MTSIQQKESNLQRAAPPALPQSVELARLGDALHEAETIGLAWHADETKATAKHSPTPENRRRKLDPYAIAAIRLLLLTGAAFEKSCTRAGLVRR